MTEKEVKTRSKTEKGFGGKRTVVPVNKTAAELFAVEALAKKAGLKPWETVGLMRHVRWAEGKQVTETDFGTALERFNYRPMGSGRAA